MKKFDNIIILHGCPMSKETVLPKSKRWMNWLEKKLKAKGFNATAPDMPMPWAPKFNEWKKMIEKINISKNSMIVAHSCAGAFIVRWLLEEKKNIKKLILVAPAKIPERVGDARNDLYNFELPKNASYIADERVVFISNDFLHHLKSFEIYKKSLNPRVIRLENKVHFLYIWTKT